MDKSYLQLSTEEFVKKYDANSKIDKKRYSKIIAERLQSEPFRKTNIEDYPFYKKLGVVTVGIFILPLRIISFIILFVSCVLTITIGEKLENTKEKYIENKESEYYQKDYNVIPKSPRGKKFIQIGMGLIPRIALRTAFGFGNINIIDKRKRDENGKVEKAPVIVSNHISLMDILFLTGYYDCVPSFVALEWIGNTSFVGNIAKSLQSIFVNPSVQQGVSKKILEHVEYCKKKGTPPIVIFPEGTTTNGTHLINFKNGAFLPKSPIQPIVLKYKYKWFNPCWVEYTAPQYFIRLCTQWVNTIEITFLPIIKPTEEEKNDITLFRDHVQEVMAKELNVPIKNMCSRRQKLVYKNYIFKKISFEECEKTINDIIAKKN